jgi:hypothetical protein
MFSSAPIRFTSAVILSFSVISDMGDPPVRIDFEHKKTTLLRIGEEAEPRL